MARFTTRKIGTSTLLSLSLSLFLCKPKNYAQVFHDHSANKGSTHECNKRNSRNKHLCLGVSLWSVETRAPLLLLDARDFIVARDPLGRCTRRPRLYCTHVFLEIEEHLTTRRGPSSVPTKIAVCDCSGTGKKKKPCAVYVFSSSSL